MLYLIAASHTDIIRKETAQQLNEANLAFIRGDLEATLSSVNAALGELDTTQRAYSEVLAFQLLLISLEDQRAASRSAAAINREQPAHGALKVICTSLESADHWHSGSLFKGLLLNQSAVHQARDEAPVWRLYTNMMMAKKLTDIHVSQQARRTISEMRDLVDNYGLHAFESLVEGLSTPLCLQSGQYERALRRARETLRVAEERGTRVAVKLALSVTAAAHLALGELDAAAGSLASFDGLRTHYVLPDSVARAAFAEIALVAAGQGARAAAELAHASWDRLGTRSACFIEDLTRPAWLVALARRAGDRLLAERSVAAVEALVRGNREIPPLETAAAYARAVFGGGRLDVSMPLDAEPGTRRAPARPAAGTGVAGTGAATAGTGAEQAGVFGPAGEAPLLAAVGAALGAAASVAGVPPPEEGARPGPGPRLPELSEREDEIARLVGRGMTNQQVATELGLSPHTVNFHLRGIFRKLSISTRGALGRIIAQLDRGHEVAVTDRPG
ncbi:helix-turn-helix transcriptional regulator [Actinosynnema pretiosum]|uniref:HTH luxR-type domain-containing protein n=1 Tax=Actinosynnema pretiosum TaxID=42197 RepID=A0A290Z887_9PSEU|nr:helix-turn-helix transcriptional regulator [Actinosynnema pretiosum]ATE55204.1 hypothetical protein CNX65_19545 [Actinosynnema pretiosum]